MPNGMSYSIGRLEQDRFSAAFWATRLGPYGERMRRLDDRYAIAASVVGAITGLTIWGTISKLTDWWSQALVGLMAVASAVIGMVPKVKHYGECASKAASLASEYGRALGLLEDALAAAAKSVPNAPELARDAVTLFDAVRAQKQALTPYPARLQDEIDAERKARGLIGA